MGRGAIFTGAWRALGRTFSRTFSRLWHRWLTPSLIKRSFFSILLVYPLLWLALLVNHYLVESDALVQNTPHYLDEDIALLNRYDTPEQVVAFMRTAMLRYRCFADTPVDTPPHFVEVWDNRQQRRVFADAKKRYPRALLADPAQKAAQTVVDGMHYQIERRDGPRWSLRVARPLITLPVVIARDAFNLALDLAMLLSLPAIMLPIWLAVMQGFRPLRMLAQHLSRREALNFAPIKLDVRYIELKPTMNALDSLLSRLRAKTLREKRFVDDAARALRAPMAIIADQVKCLTDAAGEAEKHDAEQKIGQALARAGHLIHQLLELARMDGSLEKHLQRQDIVPLVQVDLARFVDMALERDMELSLTMPESLWANLEKSSFQLILHNLVNNAIRHGQSGGRVEVELQQDRDALLLVVADDGPGIAEGNQQRVFERFWRGMDDDSPGAGLGLAIVRQAAARLGASIDLCSGIDGKGCRFSVRLPSGAAPVAARHSGSDLS
jgi:signal transduction histidine kinase